VAIAQRTGATVLTNYEISTWLQQAPRGSRRSTACSTGAGSRSRVESGSS
jgi:hypothetical protein